VQSNLVTRVLAAIVVAVGFCLAVVPAAVAGDNGPPDCPDGTVPSNPGGGWICIPVVTPGDPGDPGGGDPGDGGTGCHDELGKEIPCTITAGGYDQVWFGPPRNCYAWRVDPPPPAGNPAWEGHDPSEGNIYTCDVTACALDPGCAGWFVPGNATPPDPRVLAQRALDRMKLATPKIHMAPQPPLMTYVGLETWLWMDAGQWSDLSLTVSAGPTSVTVVAKPVKATWDLTAGSTTCTSAGRPWVKGMSSAAQTDCSYTFQKVSDFEPDGQFKVTSTLTYQVDWVCSGACIVGTGTLGQVDGLPGVSAIRVGERQTVVIH